MKNNILYECLIEPFTDGNWFWGIISWTFFGIISSILIICSVKIIDSYQWSKIIPFEQEAILLSQNYIGDTRETNTVPVVTGKGGVGVGVVSTGESEKYITVWDCGKYGKLVANNEQIFRFSREKATLLLKQKGDEVRIIGIK